MIEVIFVGNRFYKESRMAMSSFYQQVGDGLRDTDWGKLQISLSNGEEVHIRPANEKEISWAERELEKYKAPAESGKG